MIARGARGRPLDLGLLHLVIRATSALLLTAHAWTLLVTVPTLQFLNRFSVPLSANLDVDPVLQLWSSFGGVVLRVQMVHCNDEESFAQLATLQSCS